MSKIPLKPANETFTDQQWQAVFDDGDNLLVSASAGSGKTTVLVRRVIEKLQQGQNIDELLVVTFTEAAAREMKERIQQQLQKAVNQEPDQEKRAHFTKQLVLLPSANISTLHAFCLTVIRRFYYLIDLDPVFRMLTDQTEILLLQEEVWERIRETHYAAEDEAFFQLTENFSGDRSDEGLTKVVMDLYRFARANPDPKAWLQNLVENYQAPADLSQLAIYQQQLKPELLSQLELAITNYRKGVRIAELEPAFEKTLTLMSNELAQTQRIYDGIKADDLAAAYAQIEGRDFSTRFSAPRKAEYASDKDLIKLYRDTGKDLVETAIQQHFPFSPAEMLALLEQARPIVEKLADITLEFLATFQAEKLARGVLDFNDLEHYTLQILQGTGAGSEAATYYRGKFKEVLVDEYQDVNRLQEAILYWTRQVAGTGNLFMVGDVKQSIYAFRLADPTLFIEKYLAFGQEKGGRRIVLAENFRSRPEVLLFTNLIFQQIMDQRVGQIDYDQAAALIPGYPQFPESPEFLPELLLYEKNSLGKENFDSKTAGELEMTALKIRQLIDQQFLIFDKELGKERPVKYQDIVLLTPTKTKNLEIIEAFKNHQIPLEVQEAENYFQATEIQTMMSLLNIIDNPFNDIALAAVLRSPLVGLLEDELAEIRISEPYAEYFTAVEKYLQQNSGTELAKKLKGFLQQLQGWRDFSKQQPLPQLLWQIFADSAYLDYVLGLPAGQQRYANLLALVNRAETYEKSSFRGLYQFVRFIEKMQEKDQDLAEPLATPVEDAVRVMTIHASKGLEFPVVFLLDMTKNINTIDLKSDSIFEEKLGAGIKYLDPTTRIKYPTLPYNGIEALRRQKAYSEEMRKLYVALTRAEQKLFLVGSYEDREAAFKQWSKALNQENLVLNPSLRMGGTNVFMNWVGMSLVRHPAMEKYFSAAANKTLTVDYPARFAIEWWNNEQLALASPAQIVDNEQAKASKTQVDPAELQLLDQRLDYTYPFPKATQTTSYQSVSEIKRVFEDPDNTEDNRLQWETNQTQGYRMTSDKLAQPKFITAKQTDSAAVGTATHLVLQLLPLTKVPTKTSLEGLIKRLVQQKMILPEVADKIQLDNILWFYQTQLGQEILTQAQFVRREQPFAMLKTANQIYQDYDETQDELLIHGIIDGFIDYPQELVLFDFKTDYVPDSDPDLIAARRPYLGQIALYREALTEATGKNVPRAYLVFLSKQAIVEV